MSDQTEPRGPQARLIGKLEDTSGAAIALVALAMVALLSAVALAVDVGMMTTARTEMQRLGDAAAFAGAIALVQTNGDSAAAHDSAASFGSANNTVRGDNVPVLNEDVDVIPDEWTVRVRVHRTAGRANALPTFFARIFGVHQVNINTVSAAWAAPSSAIGNDADLTCPALPLALLEKYIESNGEPGWQPPEEVVGWSSDDHSTLLRLKMQPGAEDEPNPPVSNEIDYCTDTGNDSSWRCWWRNEEDDPNSPNVGAKIRGEDCVDPIEMGDEVWNAAGNKQSNVHDDFKWLIDQDEHDLSWCEECGDNGCVVAAATPTQCFAGESLRLRRIPTVDPATTVEPDDSGSNISGEVTGFAGVFVERVAETYLGNEQTNGKMNVYLRIIQQSGTGSANVDGENDPAATVRTVQLIE